MRTLRLSLVGTVILVLLGGSAGTAVARTDGSTKVTGSVLSGTPGSVDEVSEEGVRGEDWVGHVRGMEYLMTFKWSDPRLPGQAEAVWDFDGYGDETEGEVGVAMVNATWMLEGPDGYWTGPWTGWCDSAIHCRGTATLTGHGAYEGFYAVLTEQPQEDSAGTVTQVLEGAILHGQMPPVPEPLEPSAK